MKKIYLLSLSLLAIAAVSCNPTTNNTTAATVATTTGNAIGGSSEGIVYMNSDSVIAGYKMYQDLSAEFRIKTEKVQKELNMKGSSLESKYKDLENKIVKGLITRTEAGMREQDLNTERDVVLKYRDQKMQELGEEEMVLTNKISENLKNFINKYNETKKYKLIINTSAATNVVVAGDPSIDITKDILDGLNAEYTPATSK